MSDTETNVDEDVPQEIALLNRAYAALAEACSMEEVRDVRDRAEAVRSYARKARLGREILIEAAALRLRSERRLGQLLQTLPLAKAAPGNQYSTPEQESNDRPSQIRLLDIGITKSDSSRLQRIAAVPEETFQAYVNESIEANRECSTAGCLRLIRSQKTRQSRETSVPANHSPELQKLINSTRRFVTVYADLFTAGEDVANATKADAESLCRQPVDRLVEPNAHLYIMTPASRLPDALQVMESWTYQYEFCVPWPSVGTTDTVDLRNSNDLLLVGRRGVLAFPELSTETWSHLLTDGYTTDALVALIQHLSPAPYLDLTSNVEPLNADWMTVAGGQRP